MNGEEIRRRFESLRSERTTVQDVWDTIEQFVVPLHGGRFFSTQGSEHEIEWRRRNVFDSTALEACQTLAASLHGSLTSPMVKWFELSFRDKDLRSNAEAAAWLEECSDRVYMALRDSDFSLEASEVYIDLAAFGTAAIVEEELLAKDGKEWSGIDFSSVPIRECFFEEDHHSRPIRFYRLLEWTASKIVSKFGDDAPQDIREIVNAGQDLDQKHDLVFCVYERPDGTPWAGQMLSPDKRQYGFKYIRLSDASEIGEEGGYYEMPAFLPRWRKTSGSKWGYSPAMTALSDILTLQQLVEMILKATEKVVDPVMLANQRDVLGDMDLESGTMNVVRDINGFRPYESGARFDVSQLQRDVLQASIKRQFYVDQLELKDSPAMTATEAQIRYELMQRLLGPTLGRLQADFLDPMVTRTFKIMWRAGQLPDPPEVLVGADSEMDVSYIGPIPRAQRNEQAVSYERLTQFAMMLAQANPQILQLVRWEDMLRDTAQLLGVPSDTILSEDEWAELQQQMQQAQMEQAQMEQAGAEAEIGKTQAEGAKTAAEAEAMGAGNVMPMPAAGGGPGAA